MLSEIEHRILDGAERLLGRLGYRKMSMEDIARAAGVGRRTIYLHFESKQDVALCTIDRIVDRLLERLQAIACSTAPPEEKIRQMLVTRVLYRFDSVQDYYQSFHDLFAELRPAYLARRERYFQAEVAVFAGVVADGCADGAFARADGHATARTLLTTTNALLPYSLSPRELGDRAVIEAEAVAVAELVLAGLAVRPSPG